MEVARHSGGSLRCTVQVVMYGLLVPLQRLMNMNHGSKSFVSLSSGLSHLVHVNEWFLLKSQGSLRQCSCECLQLPKKNHPESRENWHEPKHFMKEYSSATVVESTISLIFWLSQSTRLPYDIPFFEYCSRNFAEIQSCLSVKIHLRYFGGKHQEIHVFRMVW